VQALDPESWPEDVQAGQPGFQRCPGRHFFLYVTLTRMSVSPECGADLDCFLTVRDLMVSDRSGSRVVPRPGVAGILERVTSRKRPCPLAGMSHVQAKATSRQRPRLGISHIPGQVTVASRKRPRPGMSHVQVNATSKPATESRSCLLGAVGYPVDSARYVTPLSACGLLERE